MELIGIFFVASGLLAIAGIAKALRPDDTARALLLALPWSVPMTMARRTVRLGAVVEASLGVCAIVYPHPVLAGLVALSYAAFLCFVLYARKRGGPLSTCGCFGRPDTPATALHVVLNGVFIATAVVVGLRPPQNATLTSLLATQPWDGLPLLFASAVGIWLGYLALSPMATLEATRRLVGRPETETVRS